MLSIGDYHTATVCKHSLSRWPGFDALPDPCVSPTSVLPWKFVPKKTLVNVDFACYES